MIVCYATHVTSGTLVKLHGAFMVAAWMFAASCGILFARYFRLTWVGKQFMGKDLWFVVSYVFLFFFFFFFQSINVEYFYWIEF